MAEQRVVVEAHLRVERQQLARAGDDQRIDFQQAAILGDEQPAEFFQKPVGRFRARGIQRQMRRQLADLKALQASIGPEWLLENSLGRVGRHVLDVHAPFARHDQHRSRGRAIDHQAQIQFARNVASFLDEHLAHDAAFRPCLNRHQAVVQADRPATSAASSAERTNCTPRCCGFVATVPLPRPPA